MTQPQQIGTGGTSDIPGFPPEPTSVPTSPTHNPNAPLSPLETSNRPWGTTEEKYQEFEKELCSLLNCLSMENGSNTPDYILAKMMTDNLRAYDTAVAARHQWSA